MQDHKYFSEKIDEDVAEGHCFFCRISLNTNKKEKNADDAYSEEHIISNRILRHFGWNTTEAHKPLRSFREGGHFEEEGDSYSRYKIPCCRLCNTKRLNNSFERLTEKLLNLKAMDIKDFSLRKQDPYEFYIWMAFLYYKSFVKEKIRERDVGLSDVISIKWMKEVYILLLAHCGLIDLSLSMSFPGSIIFFRCKTSRTKKLNFDWMDNRELGMVVVRLGEIGIIASLYDHGYLEDEFMASPLISKLRNKRLNPLQFKCMIAFAEYSLRRLKSFPRYLLSRNHGRVELACLPYHMSGQYPPSEDFRREIFSRHIIDPNGFYEFLVDEKGEFRNLSFNYGLANIKTNVLIDP